MRECYANYDEATAVAEQLKVRLYEEFSEEKQNALMVETVCNTLGILTEKQEDQVVEFE
jgi:hypothetical protein